jgi:putative endonuclease
MPSTYILECADGSYYVGSTWNLEKRLAEHQAGVGCAYTRPARRQPVTLVWHLDFEDVNAAYTLEKQIQGWSRAKRQALIDGRTGDLAALSARSGSSRELRASLQGRPLPVVEDDEVPPDGG